MMMFLAVALMAAVAFSSLAIDLFPEIEPPAISVITGYPGASAEDVESKITRHIENELSIVNNLVKTLQGRISCRSNESSGTRFQILLPRELGG